MIGNKYRKKRVLGILRICWSKTIAVAECIFLLETLGLNLYQYCHYRLNQIK